MLPNAFGTLVFTTILLQCNTLTIGIGIVHKVKDCPRDEKEWQKASNRLNCTGGFSRTTNKYHCLPDYNLTTLLEFCYTRMRTQVEIGICMVLVERKHILTHKHCGMFKNGCPSTWYYSDEMYKFPACFEIDPLQHCYTADPSCKTTSRLSTVLLNTTLSPSVNGTSDLPVEEPHNEGYGSLAIVLLAIFLIGLIGIAAIAVWEKRQRRNSYVGRKATNQTDESKLEGLLKEIRQSRKEFQNKDLLLAVLSGQHREVRKLLKEGNDPNACDEDGISFLYSACQEGHGGVVEALLENGANVNLCTALGFSPLLVACLEGRDSIVQILLNKGADVNAKGLYGVTPLYAACSKGYHQIVKVLLNNNVDVNLCDDNGLSPLYKACHGGYEKTVQTLLKGGANANLSTKQGTSPLYKTCSEGYANIVKLLINKGANVNECNPPDGSSPLFIASQNGHVDVVKLLLANGAEINKRTKAGYSPLTAARLFGHDNIAQMLEKKSTD